MPQAGTACPAEAGRLHLAATDLRKAWFTKAALYYHYRSKDDILIAIVEPIANELEELFQEAATGKNRDRPASKREFLKHYLDTLLRHRKLITYIVNDVAALMSSAIGDRLKTLNQRLHATLSSGDAPLPDRVRTHVAIGALQNGLISFPDSPDEDLRDPLLAAACGALGIRPPRSIN